MKEKDEITEMFRHRLKQTQMEVRDDFWESLQHDLDACPQGQETNGRKKTALVLWMRRLTAAASVLLVLGMASAVFWYFSPNDEIQQAFTRVERLEPQVALTHEVSLQKPVSAAYHPVCSSSHVHRSSLSQWKSSSMDHRFCADSTYEPVSVSFSITIRHQVFRRGNDQMSAYQTAAVTEQNSDLFVSNIETEKTIPHSESLRKWAVKAAVGSALPKGDYQAPMTVGLTLERRLGKRLAVESGLQYQRLGTAGDTSETLHALTLPVKLNVVCADSKRWMWYATVGGAVEKVLNKGFGEDPLRLSVSAGMGAAYKLNERLALFVEPSISHHFDTEARFKSLRTERALNVNLLCGLRMTY